MEMSNKPLNFDLNIGEVTDFFVQLGNVPQGSVKKAARTGAKIVQKKVPLNAKTPKLHGHIKRSIIIVEEGKAKRDRIKAATGKGVRNKSGMAAFDVTFDPKFNNVFQKKIVQPAQKHNGKGSRFAKKPSNIYYYPASMEYGFRHLKKGSTFKNKKMDNEEGRHFLRDTARQEESHVQDVMLSVLNNDIDRISTKKGIPKRIGGK